MMVPNGTTGNRIKCRSCQAFLSVPVLVPDATVFESEEGFQPPPAPPADADDNKKTARRRKIRRKKQPENKQEEKHPVGLGCVLIGLGVLVLLVGGGLGVRYALRKDKASEVKASSQSEGSNCNDSAWVVDAGELEKLQGRWKVIQMRRGGEEMPAKQLEIEPLIFRVEGNKLFVPGVQGQTVATTIVNLNPKLNPNQFDTKSDERGVVEMSIYTLNADELRIKSINNGEASRPFSMRLTGASYEVYTVLKREK